MIRQIAVVAAALSLVPSWAGAQTADFTVKTASALVHKGPSTGSPVIGKAPRGTQLEVTRELGDWVKVTWPESEDGSGYVHLSFGTLAPRAGAQRMAPAGMGAQPAESLSPLAASDRALPAPAASRTVYVPPPTHVVGLGGLMAGSTPAFGASARVWSARRFGVQMEMSRLTHDGPGTGTRMTSMQLTPSFIYSIADVVTDYVWVRPYVGGGVNFSRSNLGTTPEGVDSLKENALTYRGHGGAELTFSSVPRLAVTADAGYQTKTTPFEGYEIGGMGFTIAAHWYVK